MKLVMKETCVVGAGKIAERGAYYDTQNDDPTSDKVAYDLISNGRALAAELYDKEGNSKGLNPEAKQFYEDFKSEQQKIKERQAEEAKLLKRAV